MKRIYASISDDLHERMTEYNRCHVGQELRLPGILEKALGELLTKEGY